MRLFSMAVEIMPLAALFIGNAIDDIFLGAKAAVLCAVIIVVYNRWIEKRWPIFALFSALISALFTLVALLVGDSLFIKIQPTLFNGMFSLFLLGGWMRGHAVMKVFFGSQFSLTHSTWRLLSLRWGLFFAALGLANEGAWRLLDDDGWVFFKVFVAAPATLLFMLAQLPLTLRGRLPQTPPDKAL